MKEINAPPPRVWDAAFAERPRAWWLVLLFFAIATHGYSLAVTGAKFWIDSVVYFQLALALFDPDQLGRLYNSPFGFTFDHVVPGLPLLIRALEGIFREQLWPALTVLQGALSAVAVTWFVMAFSTKLSRPAQLASVILCGLHPYFMSFHAAALTESISSSITLISLGIAIRALDGRLSLRLALSLLLPLSIAAAQFRPYLGLIVILVAALVVFRRGTPRRMPLYGLTVLALAVGTLAFPVYRAALGLGFSLTNIDIELLTHVSYVSWDLDRETARSLDTVVSNAAIRERLIGHEHFEYADADRVFEDLIATGLSRRQARQTVAAATWRIRTSSPGAIERQLQLPLASIGFQYAPTCCQPNRQLTRDMTGWQLYRHIRSYSRWNSGLDSASYLETFDTYVEMTRNLGIYSEAAQDLYIARIRPYVTDSLKSFRDPLHLTFFISDPSIVVGWFGLWLCFWPGQRTTLLALMTLFAVIYGVAVYGHVFGDNRHAHVLIPVIVVGFVKAVDEFFARLQRSRLPGFKIPA